MHPHPAKGCFASFEKSDREVTTRSLSQVLRNESLAHFRNR